MVQKRKQREKRKGESGREERETKREKRERERELLLQAAPVQCLLQEEQSEILFLSLLQDQQETLFLSLLLPFLSIRSLLLLLLLPLLLLRRRWSHVMQWQKIRRRVTFLLTHLLQFLIFRNTNKILQRLVCFFLFSFLIDLFCCKYC